MHSGVRLAAALTLWATGGCADADAVEPPDASSPDTYTLADSSRDDTRAAPTSDGSDASLADSADPEDTSVAALDALDAGDATEACIEPDSWSVKRWDTAVDETGCIKVWHSRPALAAPPYSFGPGGLTLPEENHIEQGPLVGDFDLTLDIRDIIPPDAGATYGPHLYMSASSCGKSYSAQIYLYPRAPAIWVFSGAPTPEIRNLSTTSHDYLVHIARAGTTFTMTLDAADGKTMTVSTAEFATAPLSWSLYTSGNDRMTLRKLTIVGGGSEAHSDDFTCNSIW